MLAGVILAGGQSARYGSNKALERFQGDRMVDRALQSMRSHCDPVFLVANDLEPYLGVKAHLVRDLRPRLGPLGGIHTALFFSPHDWVLVRATDMPFLVPELVQVLMDCRQGADVVVPVSGKGYEPLCALYHRSCLPAVAQVLERGQRQVVAFYDRVKVAGLPEEVWKRLDPHGLSFRNVNTPEDMRELLCISTKPETWC